MAFALQAAILASMRTGKLVCAGLIYLALSSVAFAQEGRKAISKPTPHYPELAKRLNLSGTVKVEAVVAADGAVKNVRVLGGHPILVTATVDTVKQWKYEPSKTESVEQINVAFKP